MPRPDQLCECGHERQEHGRGPCSALEPCEECGGSGEREVNRLAAGGFEEDVMIVCPSCDGKRFSACECRGFKATLSAESPRTVELTREDLRELILACRAHARGWALDGRLRAEVRANYRRIALRLEEESERQDREEGFCSGCENELMNCRCTAAMEGAS